MSARVLAAALVIATAPGLLAPTAARAEEGDFSGHVGLGTATEITPDRESSDTMPSILLKSTYGRTESTNLVFPAAFDFESGQLAIGLGLGMEWVAHWSLRWRISLAAGLASRVEVRPERSYDGGGYLGAAIRHVFDSGLGASVELQASCFAGLGDAEPQLLLSPAVTAFAEF